MIVSDTIAAIATSPGASAIAVVRLSGPRSSYIASTIFQTALDSKRSQSPKLRRQIATHGYIIEPASGAIIDEVVLIPYIAPNSYTGEDLIEISCHGSPFITQQILSLCLNQGARLARPGEFTQRAFLNGKLDLTQAEAVLDLIQSKTGMQSRQALSALRGDLGARVITVRGQLMELLSRVVAGIDFPEEVGDVPLDDIEDVIDACLIELKSLAQTARSGRFLRDGVRLAIVGKPNAGKSSLLNQMLKFDRAIVTDVPGTTRDSLEEMVDINGIPVILIDTAGIRDTQDQVEQIGIERTYLAVGRCDLALHVADVTSGWDADDSLIASTLKQVPHFLIANKIDVVKEFDRSQFERNGNCGLGVLPISARTGEGMSELNKAIESWVFADKQSADRGASLNARQGELCQRAVQALDLARETSSSGMPQDCLATDLKSAVDCLSEICGEAVSEEIISNVFANFCIGK